MPAHIHLLIPGLLWPAGSARPPLDGLPLDALSRIAARSRHTEGRGAGLEALLAGALGVTSNASLALLRHRGEDVGISSEPASTVLCADPGHLRFHRDTLVLVTGEVLDVSAEEARALTEGLNGMFADVGRFEARHPSRWYLHGAETADIRFTPAPYAAGRNVQLLMPSGGQARRWRALMNEIQVHLHNHPVNAAREASAKPAINTLWFWGVDALSASQPLGQAADRLFAHAPLARGLATEAGTPAFPLPKGGQEWLGTAAGKALVVLEDLHAAFATRDTTAWREALVGLESDWFAPLLRGLNEGLVAELRLTAVSDDTHRSYVLTRRDLLCFWRRNGLADALTARP